MKMRIRLLGICILAMLQACAFDAAGEPSGKIRLDWPRDGAAVSLLTEAQKAYFATPTERRVAGFDDPEARAKLATIGWRPAPVTLVWSGTDWDRGPAVVEIRRESNGQIVRRIDMSQRTRNVCLVSNLETGTVYAWRVTVAGEVSKWGRFVTEPGSRLLDVDGVPNFRDLGGRVGLDGRRVRQGLVYRSSGANQNSTTNEFPGVDRITEKGRRTAREVLGIRTELDLRSDRECKGMCASPFGEGVRWVHVSSGCYQWITNAADRAAMAKCFRTVNDPANLPVDFHCISGQDRTGTLAFVLNAILGVAEPELSLDWEMTVFWNPATGWFSRKGRYEAMLKFFNGFPGPTLREKVEAYLKTCGITQAEIESFRKLMLEEGM